MSEGPIQPPGSAVAVVVAVVLAVFVGMWFGRPVSRPVTGGAEASGPTIVTATVDQTITVHVAGAVARPGLVELDAGSRVADAVAAAGGATSEAKLTELNLAQELVDGQQVVMPSADVPAAAGAEDDVPVRLNSADARQLEALPGVGPVLATAIVSYRDEHGPFTAVEDLLSVPGIGEAKLATIRDHVSVP